MATSWAVSWDRRAVPYCANMASNLSKNAKNASSEYFLLLFSLIHVL